MSKRKCVFNEKLQNDLDFMKKGEKLSRENKMKCTVWCNF